MKPEYSEQFLKRRKFFAVLPLIVIPFLTVLFWLLGGGHGGAVAAQTQKGLNTRLPDARSDSGSVLDKLSFYAKADQDSVAKLQQMRMDPNYQTSVSSPKDPNPLDKRIERLQREVEQEKPFEHSVTKNNGTNEVERLQLMVQTMQERKTDPDIEALNGTLDKLLAIQNPVQSGKPTTGKKGIVYPVSSTPKTSEQNFFGKSKTVKEQGFLADENPPVDSSTQGSIKAVVHGEQVLLETSTIKLRLLQDVFVNGQAINAGAFLYGKVSFENERMHIKVSSIQYRQQLFPVALTVFDMDGMEGIRIQGSSGSRVIKQSAEQGIQSSSILSFDPSLTAQAAAVGVNAAKGLLARRVKQESVTVKAGYSLLLRDDNERNTGW